MSSGLNGLKIKTNSKTGDLVVGDVDRDLVVVKELRTLNKRDREMVINVLVDFCGIQKTKLL